MVISTATLISLFVTMGFSIASYFIRRLINKVDKLEAEIVEVKIQRSEMQGEIMAILREVRTYMATKECLSKTEERLAIIETKLQALKLT